MLSVVFVAALLVLVVPGYAQASGDDGPGSSLVGRPVGQSARAAAVRAATDSRHRHSKRRSLLRKFRYRTRPGTVTLPGASVASVATTGSGGQLLTLSTRTKAPLVGQRVVLMPTAAVPTGTLGVVTGISRVRGHIVVHLRKTALSEAFSTYEVQASGTLGEASGTFAQTSTAGVVAHTAGADLLKPHFTCSGPTPTVHITVDLSHVQAPVHVKIPDYIEAGLKGPVTFSVDLHFSAASSCTASLLAAIPLGDSGFFIDTGPEVAVQAAGAASAHFTWTPTLDYEFYRDKNRNVRDTHKLISTTAVNFSGSAAISVALNLEVQLEAFKAVGVTGTVGPTLSARLVDSSGRTCRVIEGAAQAKLTAFIHVWFKTWTFTLYDQPFWGPHIFSTVCSPPASGGSGSDSGGSSGGTGGSGGSPAPSQPTWRTEQLATPPGATEVALLGVSCPATTACTGVGLYADGREHQPIAEFWNGSSWMVEAVPTPPGPYNSFSSVSCVSATACMAVGASNSGVPLSATWDGTSWTLQTVPTPADSQATYLSSVSCVSSAMCVAVGSFTDELGATKALAELWNGSSWSLQGAVAPIPAGSTNNDADSELEGIDCVNATECVAVGRFENQPEDSWPSLAESWSGSGWTVEPTPHLGPDVYTWELSSVSCSAAAACTAVGSYIDYGNPSVGGGVVAERWNGSSWTSEPPVNPPSLFSEIRSVSCTATASCLAIGLGGGYESYVWNGTAWIEEELKVIAGGINAVSCVSPTYCMAVGSPDSMLYSSG